MTNPNERSPAVGTAFCSGGMVSLRHPVVRLAHPVRLAIGVRQLPGRAPVEVELTAAVTCA